MSPPRSLPIHLPPSLTALVPDVVLLFEVLLLVVLLLVRLLPLLLLLALLVGILGEINKA